MSDPNRLGRFVWHELLTNDVAAALAFYTKVVGWKTQDFEGNPSYKLLVGSRGPSAGVMEMPEEARSMGARPNWTTYIGTPDVDATSNRVEELGGRILRAPADIPSVGRFSIVQDPQGATFALFTSPPNSPEMPGGPPALGEYSWHELATTDLDAGWAFYAELFGWVKMDSMPMGDMGVYQMFGMGGEMMGGMYVKPPQMQGPPSWLPYAMVKDTRAATATATSLGSMIVNGNMEVPGGDLITMAVDPEGVLFAVHSKQAAAAAPKKAAAKKAAAKPAKKAAAKPARKAAKKAARKPAKKAAKKKAAKKAARRTGRKKAAPKKAARKQAGRKKAARRAARRPAKKAARRGGARKAAKRPAGRKRK